MMCLFLCFQCGEGEESVWEEGKGGDGKSVYIKVSFSFECKVREEKNSLDDSGKKVFSFFFKISLKSCCSCDLLSLGLFHKKSEQINWQREYDCGVLFRRNGVQSLKEKVLDLNWCWWWNMRQFTCRYLSWSAAGESPMISEASRKARDAFCSPSAAMTWEKEFH